MPLDRYTPIRAKLVERFPRCFAPKDGPKKPLKIGIHNDLIAACPDFSEKELRFFLGAYTRSPRYLEAVMKRHPRIGLDGNECGEVSIPHAQGAASWLAQRLSERAKVA